MKKNYSSFMFLLAILFSVSSFAQNKKLWSKTTAKKTLNKELVYRKTVPNKASFFYLNIEKLKQRLENAPKRKTSKSSSQLIIDFPRENGSESFRVKEASVMAPELQNAFPDLRSYVGQSIENPSTLIRFSVTTQGLHAMILSERGTEFIDPYTKEGDNYITYKRSDLPNLDEPWECGVIEAIEVDSSSNSNSYASRNADDGMLRTFRLALASTIEYSSFHWMAAGLTASSSVAQKKAAVLAAMVVTMTRVNGVYERDLSITMTLVANNTDVIFIDSDNFSNDNAGALINESQTVIDANIQPANYDIGHTFSTGGGGLAQLNSPCTSNKARGITGSPAPVGDAYDIDYVAHEMGHQFGAPHTFNGNASNCAGGNREATNAYEPGSGSTIMAYAGICAPQNVQSNSDDYFHQKSLQMIWDNISTGNSQCGAQTATGNNAPTANAGSDYIIPKSTPYMLAGNSTDTDGTATHTYTWEQYDLGPAGIPTETTVTGPMVRTFKGTTNKTRYIPNLPHIINNGATSTEWEKLASVARIQKFRLTVRDNDMNGGQTAVDEMMTTIDAVSGPFAVTSQNSDGISWDNGTTELITWDVAGTNTGAVNTPNVDILLSTDGGVTFGTTLASNVPNNGSYTVTVPSIQAPFCRVMVKGNGNIFFNVNSKDFAVGGTVTTTCQTYSSGNLGVAIPDGVGANQQGSAITNTITIPAADNTSIGYLKVNVDVTHTYIQDLVVQFSNANGDFANLWARNCAGEDDFDITFEDGAGTINCANTTGNYDPADPLSEFSGMNSAGDWTIAMADFYNGDTGTFNDWSIEVCSSTFVAGVEAFNLENTFSVFPNPNHGEFTIKLNSPQNNDILVSVFDIRGRSIMNKSYSNSGNFNQTINLGNVQSGIYLLKVNQGEKTLTKKIIIE